MNLKLFKVISITLLLSFSLCISAGAVSVTDFSDVSQSDWYYSAVDYATSNGLFNGTSDTTFSPNTSMTRGMFVTVLGRIAKIDDFYGRTQSTPFNDVTQADYFFPYAIWANDNGIVTGVGNNVFNPNGEISREQMGAILFRYADKFGCDLTYSAEKYSKFSDTASVPGYAITAMQWATSHGIINGSDSKLSPQDNASRAQVAQIFLNFSKLETNELITTPAPIEPVKPTESPSPTVEPVPTETPKPSTPTVDWENYNPTYERPTGKSSVDADGGYYDYDLANEIMDQVNTLREKNRLDALLYHPKLQEWAGIRAKEQTVREGHTRPDGTNCLTVGQGSTSENITILRDCTDNEFNSSSEFAARAVNNWYTSTKGHKEAMLSSFNKLGSISCYIKGDTIYIVHLFSNQPMYLFDSIL